MSEVVSFIRSVQMSLPDNAERCYLSVIWDKCQKCTSPMDVQKNIGGFLFFLFFWDVFLGRFCELGRNFSDLRASPRRVWN